MEKIDNVPLMMNDFYIINKYLEGHEIIIDTEHEVVYIQTPYDEVFQMALYDYEHDLCIMDDGIFIPDISLINFMLNLDHILGV